MMLIQPAAQECISIRSSTMFHQPIALYQIPVIYFSPSRHFVLLIDTISVYQVIVNRFCNFLITQFRLKRTFI